MNSPRQREQGNVLFLILIAVALFAALSYAVTRTTQGTGKNTNEEEMTVDAARVVQECATLRQSVARFMTISDMSADDVQLNDGTNTETPCRTGNDCLFSSTGGAAIIPIPPIREGAKGALSPLPMVYRYYNISDGKALTGYDSDKPLLMFEARNLSYEFCMKINKAVGAEIDPQDEATAKPNFRDDCVAETFSDYYFRCPLVH